MPHDEDQPRERRPARPLPTDPWALLMGPDIDYLARISRQTRSRWVKSGAFPRPDVLLPGLPPRPAWRLSTYEAWSNQGRRSSTP